MAQDDHALLRDGESRERRDHRVAGDDGAAWSALAVSGKSTGAKRSSCRLRRPRRCEVHQDPRRRPGCRRRAPCSTSDSTLERRLNQILGARLVAAQQLGGVQRYGPTESTNAANCSARSPTSWTWTRAVGSGFTRSSLPSGMGRPIGSGSHRSPHAHTATTQQGPEPLSRRRSHRLRDNAAHSAARWVNGPPRACQVG